MFIQILNSKCKIYPIKILHFETVYFRKVPFISNTNAKWTKKWIPKASTTKRLIILKHQMSPTKSKKHCLHFEHLQL
jgi:hypothetical protein